MMLDCRKMPDNWRQAPSDSKSSHKPFGSCELNKNSIYLPNTWNFRKWTPFSPFSKMKKGHFFIDFHWAFCKNWIEIGRKFFSLFGYFWINSYSTIHILWYIRVKSMVPSTLKQRGLIVFDNTFDLAPAL